MSAFQVLPDSDILAPSNGLPTYLPKVDNFQLGAILNLPAQLSTAQSWSLQGSTSPSSNHSITRSKAAVGLNNQRVRTHDHCISPTRQLALASTLGQPESPPPSPPTAFAPLSSFSLYNVSNCTRFQDRVVSRNHCTPPGLVVVVRGAYLPVIISSHRLPHNSTSHATCFRPAFSVGRMMSWVWLRNSSSLT